MDSGEMFAQALLIMAVGTAMVFAVLAVFYGLIKLLMWLFPADKDR